MNTPIFDQFDDYPPGTFVRLLLPDSSFGYARALTWGNFAFYDYRTSGPSNDLDVVAARPVLYKLTVRIPNRQRWEQIGERELEGDLASPVVFFTQDVADHRLCTIFDTAGAERFAAPEECIGLEYASVWEQDGVERRLLDGFEGCQDPSESRRRVRFND